MTGWLVGGGLVVVLSLHGGLWALVRAAQRQAEATEALVRAAEGIRAWQQRH